MLRGIETHHNCKRRIDADETTVRRGLEYAFNCIFKDASIFFLTLLDLLLCPFPIGNISDGFYGPYYIAFGIKEF